MTWRRTLVGLVLVIGTMLAPRGMATPATSTFCLDRDADAVHTFQAGVLWNVNLIGPTTTPPARQVTAFATPFLENVVGLAVSLTDGRIFFGDARANPADPGRVIFTSCGTSSATILAESAAIREPSGLTFLPDGRLVLSDRDADPATLGPDSRGGNAPGALFWIDVTTGAVSLLSDGTAHSLATGMATAFQEPVAVAHDPVGDQLFVADAVADPLGAGHLGAVYAVSLTDGTVTLVSSTSAFLDLRSLAVRSDGFPIVVDAAPSDSIVWALDPGAADPEANATAVTAGPQYALLEAVALDEDDNVYVTDLGVWHAQTGQFLVLPAIYRVDSTVSDPTLNGVVVQRSGALTTPIALETRGTCSLAANQLAVSDPVSVTTFQSVFGCTQGPWSFCPARTLPAQLGVPVVLVDELATFTDRTVTYFEVNATTRILLEKSGTELIVIP